MENLGASVLHARPPPHILVSAVVSGELEDAGGNGPQDHANDEPGDGEQGVVHGHLLGSPVAAATVADENGDADQEGYTGDG